MRIEKLQIQAFGKLQNLTLTPQKGLNLLCAPNESGKTTLRVFLQMLFYGAPGRATDLAKNPRKKYAPFSGEAMAGAAEFSAQGARWRLERRFGATAAGDRTALWNLDEGKQVALPPHTEPGERFFGLGAAAAERALFLGQLTADSIDPDGDFQRRLSNLALSGEEAVSLQTVGRRLKQAREAQRSSSGRAGALPKLERERDALLSERDAAARRDERRTMLETQLENATAATERLTERLRDLDGAIAAAETREKAAALDRAIAQAEELEARKAALRQARQALRLTDGTTADAAFADALDRLRLRIETAETAAPAADEEQRRTQAEERLALLRAEQARETETLREREAATAHAPGSATLFFVLAGLFAAVSIAGIALPPLLLLLLPAAGFAGFGGLRLKRQKDYRRACAVREETRRSVETRATAIAQQESICALFSAAGRPDPGAAKAAERDYLQAVSRYQPVETRAEADAALATLRDALRAEQEARAGVDALSALATGTPLETLRREREALPLPPETDNPAATRDGLRAEQARLRDSLQQAQTAATQARTELQTAFRDQPDLASLEREIAERQREIDRRNAFCAACALAEQTLAEAAADLRRNFSPALSRRAGEILAALTDGAYTEAVISAELKAESAGAGQLIAAPYLSSGAADQLYLALRLAVSDRITEPDDPPPLLLDDVLLQYDDARAAAALRFLQDYAQTRQVFFFTCHRAYADALPDAHRLELA